MRTEGSIVIDKPIELVFRITTDLVSEWSSVVVEDELIDDRPAGIGSTFRSVTEENGVRMEFVGKVVKNDPPNEQCVHLSGDKFDLDVEYYFEAISPTATRVTQVSTVNARGLAKVLFSLFGWAMKGSGSKALQKEFQNLKAFCEGYDES